MGAVGVLMSFALVLVVLLVFALWLGIKGSPGSSRHGAENEIRRGDAKWRGKGGVW